MVLIALDRVVATYGVREAYGARCGRRPEVPAIIYAAVAGDTDTRKAIKGAAQTQGRIVTMVAAVAHPDPVLIDGSVGGRPEIVQAARREVARPFPIRVEESRLGRHAAVSGAVAIGLTELHTALLARSAPGAAMTLPVLEDDLVGRMAR